MFPHQNKLLAICAAAALSACATQQNPAPVVAGNSNSVYTPSMDTAPTGMDTAATAANNPYGATPYDANTANTIPGTTVNDTAVMTSPNTSAATTAAASPQPYIGNYSPVDVNASTHIVERGDTVYNISKRYGISQSNLRAWNNIGEDNAISLGQTLRVKPAGSTSVSTAPVTTPRVPTTTTTTTTTANTSTNHATVSGGNTRTVAGLVWQAPTSGKIIQSFGNGNNGIDIGGTRGQPIYAAANGQVVYSGVGLRGYGNLLIIQHNSNYLTAYGHNEKPLLVQEGEYVKRGQHIANMGSSDSSSGVKLHFEVRENGTAVNPAKFVDIK